MNLRSQTLRSYLIRNFLILILFPYIWFNFNFEILPSKSIFTTMQLIADVLSFQNNQDVLSQHFKQSDIDWDNMVNIASHHLMLPALYCRLKEKGLLLLIPEDLSIYLEEITTINRGRNEILLKEVHEISEILKNENIEHVFIKGTALIASDVFKDHGERMIGDIDILVAEHQIYTAFDIMTNNGYTQSLERDYKSDTGRHLQRQVSPHKFGAIELHSEILHHTQKHLILKEQVLKNKRIINDIAVPSLKDSITISILALQINDKAHLFGYLQFKTIYDCLALGLANNQTLLKELATKKYSQSFLHISSVFFKELTPEKPSNYSTFLKHYFVFRLHYPKLGNIAYSTVIATNKNLNRLRLFVANKHYRTYILKNKILTKKEKLSL